jgi:single-strand DNA-binding protein
MASVNKVILIGALGKDPELKFNASGVAMCSFSMATSESWKDQDGNKQDRTEWHNVVAWRKLAEICGEYLKKGSKVYIEGKLQTSSYEKDGQKHYSTKVVADNVVFLSTKKEETQSTQEASPKSDTSNNSDLPF